MVVEDEEIIRKLACKVLEKNGYIAYIRKPFNPDDLILKVRKVLDEA